jgi:dysferlin
MKATIPNTKDLRIRVMDFDLLSSNDLIGETVIDLENRLLSRHNALLGLPQSYCSSGICEWRNSRKPTDILEDFCKRFLDVSPVYHGSSIVKVGRRVYRLADFGK